ncbi:flagellar motor stator protein MotA [Marinicrinis sediminis]|uniref:Flagellar motor stator protein MotA n=1 Tax=Marinicrinis sediminis TaxID=1652465 RepID=A0ABW5RG82_9BACL
MEKSSIIGIGLAVISIGLGMVLKGAGVGVLLNYAALLIIFGGTAASLFVAFPMSDMKKMPQLFKLIFVERKLLSKKELIQIFVEWASITRREGLLALEGKIEEIDDDFLRSGMRMIIDGNDHDFVRDVLMEDISAMEDRHRIGSSIFQQAGTYAPTLGVLGAVVGLIAALGNLSDIDKLGHSIAAAFVATLFGIFSGYVLWHPMSNKLKRLSKQEVDIKLMMVEGLLSIQSGVSTIAISQKLSVFLTPEERKQADEDPKGEGLNEEAQGAS